MRGVTHTGATPSLAHTLWRMPRNAEEKEGTTRRNISGPPEALNEIVRAARRQNQSVSEYLIACHREVQARRDTESAAAVDDLDAVIARLADLRGRLAARARKG